MAYRLTRQLVFPHPELADADGLLAIGGDLSERRLLLAYQHGIFPWYSEGLPILWHSPDPRCVLLPDRLHVGRTLAKTVRRRSYEVTFDEAFERVIHACASRERPGQDGTWITEEMVEAYVDLHRSGYAHSVEAWREGELVGGLYGVSLGGVFFGESMFAHGSDASKVAIVTLAQQLLRWGIDLIDCQVPNDHTRRLGAEAWPRSRFLAELAARIERPTRRGLWRRDADLPMPP